eukprot:879976_1
MNLKETLIELNHKNVSDLPPINSNAFLPTSSIPIWNKLSSQRSSSVHQILEKLKIALTFLLHDESPMWKEEDIKENNAFEKRLTQYSHNPLSKYEDVLNSLFDQTYASHHASLHSVWSKWMAHTTSNLDFDQMIQNNAQILDDDCVDLYHEAKYVDTHSAKALSNVGTRKEMEEWINKYKAHSNCNLNELGEEKNARMFIDLWSWQSVVAAIEDAQQLRLKHFASVFWQYQINGKELLAMNAQQIQFLVECWCANNIEIQSVESQLRSESEWMKTYIDKLRIDSHCIARYYVSLDIIDWIIHNNAQSRYYEDAINIKYCIESLRSKVEDGPNQYWKLNAHFFNKIDNYLSVLIVQPQIREMYSICFPHFVDPKDTAIKHQHIITSSNRKATHNENHRKSTMKDVEEDALDMCTDKCCKHDMCDDCSRFVHNLNRFYLKIGCLMVIAMVLGSALIISFYYASGMDQANDAMFLSLEAIGDRASFIMTDAFWIAQLFASLTIGGLTTGDLLPNASLHSTFDELFGYFCVLKRMIAGWVKSHSHGLHCVLTDCISVDDKRRLMVYTSSLGGKYNFVCCFVFVFVCDVI